MGRRSFVIILLDFCKTCLQGFLERRVLGLVLAGGPHAMKLFKRRETVVEDRFCFRRECVLGNVGMLILVREFECQAVTNSGGVP